MRKFACSCDNTLFFDNSRCLKCGKQVGICSVGGHMSAAPKGSRSFACSHEGCGAQLRACANRAPNAVCNRWKDARTDGELCDYCVLTTVIPDLSVDGNLERWRAIARAKQRVLFELDILGLPFRPEAQPDAAPPLSFQFKADAARPAPTGHDNGLITLNIKEADPVEREKARIQFEEPHRTIVGHFRHELGHYFWETLVKNQRLEEYRALFGNEEDPTYSDALARYYKEGPPTDWQTNHISAYATMHSWEDFAETFNIYLDMVGVLITGKDFGLTEFDPVSLESMLQGFQKIGFLANELNRDMGLLDLVPEVFVAPVVEKLRFVHSAVRAAVKPVDKRRASFLSS